MDKYGNSDLQGALVDETLANKTCVVLGAGGFLGRPLCHALLEDGACVRAFGRNVESLPDSDHIEIYSGEFSDLSALRAAVKSADVVFHLVSASNPGIAERDRKRDVTANLLGSLDLIDVCCSENVPRIVFASSGGTVYGHSTSKPSKETDETSPHCSYGITKLAIEHHHRLANSLRAMSNICLRIANPFGPGQRSAKGQGVIDAFIRAALTGKPITIWGDGNAVRDYVYIDDTVAAFLLAAKYHGDREVFNVSSAIGRTLNEVIDDLESVVGRPISRSTLESRPFDLRYSVLSNDLARAELGWAPITPWKEALHRTVQWVRSDLLKEKEDQ